MKKNNKKLILPEFLQTPIKIIRDKKLRRLDKEVYAVVLWYAQLKNKKCQAFNKTIATILQVHHKTIGDSLNRLEERKHIKRLFYDKANRRRIEIIPLVLVNKSKLIKKCGSKYTQEEWDEIADIGTNGGSLSRTEFWANKNFQRNAIKQFEEMRKH